MVAEAASYFEKEIKFESHLVLEDFEREKINKLYD